MPNLHEYLLCCFSMRHPICDGLLFRMVALLRSIFFILSFTFPTPLRVSVKHWKPGAGSEDVCHWFYFIPGPHCRLFSFNYLRLDDRSCEFLVTMLPVSSWPETPSVTVRYLRVGRWPGRLNAKEHSLPRICLTSGKTCSLLWLQDLQMADCCSLIAGLGSGSTECKERSLFDSRQ